jgi:hypothetical protein
MYVAEKANKTLSLSQDVIEELEEEPNMSQIVDSLLKEYYDL